MCHWRRYNFRICYHYNDRDPNDYICYTDSPQCNRSGIGCRFRGRRYPGTKLLRRISCMGWRYLWRFFRCYRYLRSYLVKYNPSVADGLRAGDVLYFPVELLDSKQPEQPAKNSYDNSGVGSIPINRAASHHVQKGETIYGICRHYGISEEDLIALNPSLKGGALKQGTILLLPDSEGAESTVGNDNHQYAPDTHKEIEPKRALTRMSAR